MTAETIVRAVESDAVGVANIGTGAETTVNELYRQLMRLTGAGHPAEHGPARPGEQRRSLLDASRAKALLGWSTTTSLDEGLAQTVAWFRKELKK